MKNENRVKRCEKNKKPILFFWPVRRTPASCSLDEDDFNFFFSSKTIKNHIFINNQCCENNAEQEEE